MRKGVKRNRWTSADDKILIDAIKSNVSNLHKAFSIAGEATGRSAGACAIRWYTVLIKEQAVFGTYADGGMVYNHKVSTNVVVDKENLFRRLFRFFKK